MKQLITGINITLGSFIILILLQINSTANAAETTTEAPKVPFQYALGVQKYDKMCAGCHGKWLDGTKSGPPLLHPFYKPSHHADNTFYRAALQGVKAHHWEFGDMPPVPGATREDIDAILPFIRWFQKEKGLYK